MRPQGLAVGLDHRLGCPRQLDRKVQHRHLTRRDVGLAVVHRHLVGNQRIFRVDPQDRAVRDDAVETMVHATGRHDDHLALGFRQRGIAQHQRIVVGEESPELIRPVRQGKEDVGNEARLFLDLQHGLTDVLGQLLQSRDGVTADVGAHGGKGTRWLGALIIPKNPPRSSSVATASAPGLDRHRRARKPGRRPPPLG